MSGSPVDTKSLIGGIPITVASRDELTDAIVRHCHDVRSDGGTAKVLVDANGHALSLYRRDTEYRWAVDHADVVHADGGFIVTLSRLLTNVPIKERSATTDLIHDVASVAAEVGLSFYLLGGSESLNRRCADALVERHVGLEIAGRHHGYFDSTEESDVVRHIRDAAPDIVWVGLGKPREQIFAVTHSHAIPAGWIVTCGGCFNFVTGDYRRAPAWMQRLNLEWFHRLMSDPGRLFWRYLVTSPHALIAALLHTRRRPVDD